MNSLLRSLSDTIGSTVRSQGYIRRLLIMAWHIVGILIAYQLAFLLRFDGNVPLDYRYLCWVTLPGLLAVYLMAFALFRLYSGMWTFFSIDDAMRIVAALISGTAVFGGMIFAVRDLIPGGYPRSVLVLTPMLMAIWMASVRLGLRYYRQHRNRHAPTGSTTSDRILVVGKPDDADLVVRAARQGGLPRIVGIISDNSQHVGLRMHSVPILGTVSQLGQVTKSTRASCILVLPPFNRPRQLNEIVEQCASAGVVCAFRTIPTISDLAGGRLTASSIQNVDAEDLLGRGPTLFDRTEVRRYLKGKRVLVTGAGGSIGSELCRQIATYEPASLVLFELSEIALYTIEQELAARYPSLQLIPVAGDVRHAEEIEAAVLLAGGIDIVYHAAAYKHVPLMEQNVPACFRTNVLGTARLADVARARGIDRFVMISSDKAVNPTSIMGATKRLAERIVNESAPQGTTFVSVRFGNVIGSSGSVIPLFKRQIAAGGPVTVTTPDMRRFFMTIPEAVNLVLMAGTVGRHGDIMVLEMGESVRIVDLARRLIELCGLLPDRDIRIEFTGLRPGEKEYEEVMTLDENVARTAFEKIWVLNRNHDHIPAPPVPLDRIEDLVHGNDSSTLRTLVKELVPEHRFGAPTRTAVVEDSTPCPPSTGDSACS